MPEGILAKPLPALSSWVGPRRNVLASLGAGLASGRNFGDGVANALRGLPGAMQADDQVARMEQEERERQAAIEEQQRLRAKYSQFFQTNGQPEYAQLVADGVLEPGDAYFKWKGGQPAPAKPEYREVDGKLLKIVNDDVSVAFDPGAKQPAAPSGYRYKDDGALEAIPGGPATHQNKPTDAQVRASSLAGQVQPDVELLLGTAEQPGVFEAMGNGVDQALNGVNIFGMKPATGFISEDYKRAQNAVTNIAQSYLYVTSGAAAPAEEVKKIADLVTPAPFDPPAVIADKKARLQSYVKSIEDAAQRETFGGAGDGWTVLGVE